MTRVDAEQVIARQRTDCGKNVASGARSLLQFPYDHTNCELENSGSRLISYDAFKKRAAVLDFDDLLFTCRDVLRAYAVAAMERL